MILNVSRTIIVGVKNILYRLFDIIIALLALILFSPLMLIIALIIKFYDKGPIIFKQKRVGKNGKIFYIYKFRTMYPDAENRLKELLNKDPELRKEWYENFKLKNDPRITPIGKFLRKTSLDELPQFFNVLKGDMSIVGPRPVTKEELELHYKDKTKYYVKVKPGITGYWQVEARGDESKYEDRVNMDIWYIKHRNFFLDIKIILKTILVMLKGKGS